MRPLIPRAVSRPIINKPDEIKHMKKLTDLPGIGEKTEKDLRTSFAKERSTSRVGDELLVSEVRPHNDEGGILDVKLDRNQKESVADEIGRPVGGVLGSSRTSTGRTSKIPDGHKRKGEFVYEAGARQKAHEKFSDLPKDRRQQDRNHRARVTTDYDRWKDNTSGLDFPGVDTPRRKPTAMGKDIGFTVDDL